MTRQTWTGNKGSLKWNPATLEVVLDGIFIGYATTWNEALDLAEIR